MPKQPQGPSRVIDAQLTRIAAAFAIAGLMFVAGRASADPGDLRIRRVPASVANVQLSSARQLVGFADDVFLGHVVATAGQQDGFVPQTRFRVEVVESFKGALKGSVIVNQQGGYRRAHNELVLVSGDDLLEVDRTYLIATLHNQNTGVHTLVPVLGDVLVETEQQLGEIITRFREATEEGSQVGGARFAVQ